MTIAPRIQIYTELACDQYKPEYSNGTVGIAANTTSIFSEKPARSSRNALNVIIRQTIRAVCYGP